VVAPPECRGDFHRRTERTDAEHHAIVRTDPRGGTRSRHATCGFRGLGVRTRLQFWLDDATAGSAPATILHLRLDAFVRAPATRVWERMMRIFWSRSGSWCERAIPNNWLR